MSKIEALQRKKRFLAVWHGSTVEELLSRSSQGTAGTAGLSKRLKNRKANCFTLLKRITRLKCVNSEFKSVDIHPKQGCLTWPYGTMSESP